MSRDASGGPYSEDADRSMEHPNPSDLAQYAESGRVVGIGAICDFESGPPPYPYVRPQLRFSIKEFVVLEDGRHVVVNERELGYSTPIRQVVVLEDGRRVLLENVTILGGGMALDSFRQDVLNAVLPDDDEALKDDHPWSYLAERTRRLGIEVTSDELKALDYEVVLTERVVRWLSR